jgi:hypothetical protein
MVDNRLKTRRMLTQRFDKNSKTAPVNAVGSRSAYRERDSESSPAALLECINAAFLKLMWRAAASNARRGGERQRAKFA